MGGFLGEDTAAIEKDGVRPWSLCCVGGSGKVSGRKQSLTREVLTISILFGTDVCDAEAAVRVVDRDRLCAGHGRRVAAGLGRGRPNSPARAPVGGAGGVGEGDGKGNGAADGSLVGNN